MFCIILKYVILTIIDQKIIEFELLVSELCPFFAKVPQNKIFQWGLHSKQVITASECISHPL